MEKYIHIFGALSNLYTISHTITHLRNSLKQYKNLCRITHVRCTLKTVQNFTQNHTFAIFFQNSTKTHAKITFAVHSQKCTTFYGKSHICGALSKHYKRLGKIAQLQFPLPPLPTSGPIMHFWVQSQSSTKQISRKITHL